MLAAFGLCEPCVHDVLGSLGRLSLERADSVVPSALRGWVSVPLGRSLRSQKPGRIPQEWHQDVGIAFS